MAFAGDIPHGYCAQLMSGNLDTLIESSAQAAAVTYTEEPVLGDILSIAISCIGRRMVLRERTAEELKASLGALPPNAHQVGFYSYGEISPSGGYCDLHNQTMTITTICEIQREIS